MKRSETIPPHFPSQSQTSSLAQTSEWAGKPVDHPRQSSDTVCSTIWESELGVIGVWPILRFLSLSNQRLSDARLKKKKSWQNEMFITLNCSTCVWSGPVCAKPGFHLHHKCGNHTNAELPMGPEKAHDTLPGRAGDFWKKKKKYSTHIEQIQPHASLWEPADDIHPHISTLKILFGLICVQFNPLTQSSWKW